MLADQCFVRYCASSARSPAAPCSAVSTLNAISASWIFTIYDAYQPSISAALLRPFASECNGRLSTKGSRHDPPISLSFSDLVAYATHQFNQVCLVVIIIMYLAATASLWMLISFTALVAAAPYCSMIYGRPNSGDCRRILYQFTGSRPERAATHCFAPAGLERPDDITNPQWVQKVDIPKFWARGKCYRTILFWPC